MIEKNRVILEEGENEMNPMLIEFPAKFTTERLVIRMPKPGDGKVV